MDDDKIVLDRKSFEALAVDTRVKILKSLKERRKTLTEIAKEQGMSVSGIKEHLSTLEGVGLIEKKDDGHKWKYYELTRKGRDIVGPKEVRVLILLSISILTLLASLVFMLPAQAPMAGAQDPELRTMDAEAPMAPAPSVYESAAAPDEQMLKSEADAGGAAANDSVPESEEPDKEGLPIPLIIAAISLLTITGCVGIMVRNRMR